MLVVLRYAFLLALGAASIFAFVSAMAATGQMLIGNGEYTIQNPREMSAWVLVGMAALSAASLLRFAYSGIPSMIKSWFQGNKDKLATLVVAGIVCVVFLVV